MKSDGIKEIFQFLTDNKDSMSAGQVRFIDGLKKYYRHEHKLTDKQLVVLYEINFYIRDKIQAE